MFYSASTCGFYTADINGSSIPTDAVEITAEEYRILKDGEDRGLIIQTDEAGQPILVERPAPAVDYPALIAARRYQAETSGTIVNGMLLDTGRDSQALVTGAALAATLDQNYVCKWKTIEGFFELSAQQIIGIASTMRAHVQACFDREAELLAALEAGTFTDDQLDQGWPD